MRLSHWYHRWSTGSSRNIFLRTPLRYKPLEIFFSNFRGRPISLLRHWDSCVLRQAWVPTGTRCSAVRTLYWWVVRYQNSRCLRHVRPEQSLCTSNDVLIATRAIPPRFWALATKHDGEAAAGVSRHPSSFDVSSVSQMFLWVRRPFSACSTYRQIAVPARMWQVPTEYCANHPSLHALPLCTPFIKSIPCMLHGSRTFTLLAPVWIKRYLWLGYFRLLFSLPFGTFLCAGRYVLQWIHGYPMENLATPHVKQQLC